MTTLHIHQRVPDYHAWKRGFDHVLSRPLADVVSAYRVWRTTDDPSFVVIELTFDSRAAAELFIRDPEVAHELAFDEAEGPTRFLEYLDEVATYQGVEREF